MTRNNKERDNLLDQLVTDLAMKRSPSSHPPHPHLECKETVTSWQALAVLSPRILMARSKPQLDNRPPHGPRRIPGFLLHSIVDRTGCWAANRAQSSCSHPTLLCVCSRASPRQRACSGKDAHWPRRDSTRQAQPPCRCWLKRGGPSVSLDLTVTRAGNAGFFLSHLLESVPGRALASEAAQALESGLRCSCRRGAGRSPPRGRCLSAARAGAGPWGLPFKPSHRPHAVLPAAAAARSNEQLSRPSSRQRPNLQVAGSGSGAHPRKRNPSPSALAGPPSHAGLAGCRCPLLCCPLVEFWRNCRENSRGIFCLDEAAASRISCSEESKKFEGNRTRAALLNGFRQRILRKPVSLKGFI